MKKLLALATIIGLLTASCRKIVEENIIVGGGNENLILKDKISSDLTLKAGNTYKISGKVYVTSGAKLTIEPGTIIQGEKATRGVLVITRGSQIIADGTKEKPIIFTSDDANPQRGDWGGIVVLGYATTNSSYNGQQGIGSVEGGVNNDEGLGIYGGTNDDDNSGTLRYVRIEYAGYAFLPDNELNGLTLASVGRNTIVDFVEVYKANDDAIECFGGTVNIRHAVLLSSLDDDFDSDNGYRGHVQFGIILRDSSIADISKSNGWESDNDANGSSLTPQTAAVYSNITAIGPRATLSNIGNSLFNAGAQIRRNSSISIYNSIIMGYPTGILIDASKGTPTDNNIQSGNLQIQRTIVAGCATPLSYSPSTSSATGWTTDELTTWFKTPADSNMIYNTSDEVKLTAPFNYSNPDFTPQAASPVLTGGNFVDAKLTGFTPTAFRGAVGTSGTAEGDWWKGWTKLDLGL